MTAAQPSPSLTQVVAGSELSARQLHDLLRLRVDIFVVEQACPYSDIDGRDLESETVHYWRADDDGVTCAIRILVDPRGRRIGRVVTREDQRGKRLAGTLIAEALEDLAGYKNAPATVLDAQSHLRAFYESLGYIVDGPEYIEDDIPHLPMFRPSKTRE